MPANVEPALRPRSETNQVYNLSSATVATTPQPCVFNLSICHCPHGRNPHLIARKAFVSLERGSAFAISYTWGEFSRTKRDIGHFSDPTQRLIMELGEEWVFGESYNGLINTLVEICRSNEYCWIDQLSINQNNEEEVKATLAKIPDIYRNFDVVVLLPGAMCDCVEGWISGRKSAVCWNNIGFGHWFQRLWTLQELLYARNIQARWIRPNILPCIGLPGDVGTLLQPGYRPRLNYGTLFKLEELASSHNTSKLPANGWVEPIINAWHQAYISMSIWAKFHLCDGDNADHLLIDFLYGIRLESTKQFPFENKHLRFIGLL